jgi:2,4-dienoyl-CoA reductase-like NADH-dependent reductase (Old Yellow Enzyme family)
MAFGTPRSLEKSEIETIIKKFAFAAKIAKQTGFTGVQVHGAHGYLLSSFLNPLANVRKDEYGGSLKNRARMLLEVVRAIRNEVGPKFPVGVKLNTVRCSSTTAAVQCLPLRSLCPQANSTQSQANNKTLYPPPGRFDVTPAHAAVLIATSLPPLIATSLPP